MKKHALKVFTMLSLFVMLAMVSVYAQSASTIMVNIPFNFVAGKTTLPAGEYTVKLIEFDRILIQSADSRASAMVLTMPVQARSIQSKAKLLFNKYGDRYFLSQVWISGDDIGYELHKTRAEVELAKSVAKPQRATLTASTH